MKQHMFLCRLTVLALCLCLLCPTAMAKTKASPTPAPRDVETDVIEDVPERIQQLLDLAYQEWS